MDTGGTGDSAFTGQVPELYERVLVPMIFAEPARLLAATVAASHPSDVLETAAGTGALTRELERTGAAAIVATDLNAAMVQQAQSASPSSTVRWQVADALDLPFADQSFDAVACQFGAMFFPDKVAGYAEALRVLRPGGLFAFNVWDRIECNAVAAAVTDALADAVGDSSLEFLRRTPHGYFDESLVASQLEAAGFGDIRIQHCDGTSRSTPHEGALAYCQGTPLRGEIEQHPSLSLEEATRLATEALECQFGTDAFDAPTRWLQVTARRPE